MADGTLTYLNTEARQTLNWSDYSTKTFATQTDANLIPYWERDGEARYTIVGTRIYYFPNVTIPDSRAWFTTAEHVGFAATSPIGQAPTNMSVKRSLGYNTWEISWTNPSGITDENYANKAFFIFCYVNLLDANNAEKRYNFCHHSISEKAREYDVWSEWRPAYSFARYFPGANSSDDVVYTTYQTPDKFMPTIMRVTLNKKENNDYELRCYWVDPSTGTEETGLWPAETLETDDDGVLLTPTIEFEIFYGQRWIGRDGPRYNYNGRMPSSNLHTKATLAFTAPEKPLISDLEYDKNSGLVSCAIETPNTASTACVDHVEYDVLVSKSSGETIYSKTVSSSELTYDFSFDIADRFSFAVGDAITFRLRAKAYGLGGTSQSERKLTFGIALPPSTGQARLNSGRVFLPLTMGIASQNDESAVPITGVKLQLLRSVALYTEADATASEDWADTSIVDNDQCTGLSIPVEDVTPSAGNATWLRVKYWTHDESIFYSYTRPVRLTFLEIPAPTAADDEVTILSVAATGEETDVEVHVAWDVAGTDDATHTEVSWSDRENAWKSTDQPKSFTASDQVWDEGQVTSGNKTYHGSTHVVISGMDAGKTYFIRARRVLVPESSQEGTTTYGPYTPSRSVSIGMGEVAGSVVLYGPHGIDEGNDLTLNWILASDERQLYYRVILTNTALNDVVLVSANSASTKCTIPWERIRPYHEEYGDLTLVVAVGTESIAATSASINVMIYPKATLSMSVSETQRVQPIRVSLASDRNDMPVSIVINSQNAVDDGMLGSDSVTVADATVYDGVVTPSWTIASEYVTQDLEEAQEALEQAREDYDAAYATLVEARDAYYMAVSTHKTLEDILASMPQDDEGYEDMEQAVADAAQAVEDALDAYEAVDISAESAAYESAISDYADAEADALTASLDALPFVAEVDVTTTTKLIDGGRYEILACGSDPSGNAISDVQTATFDVAWSHKAPMPWDEVTLTPAGDVSGNDFGAYVDIQLGEPAGAFESDVYDVYRVSGSYVTRIARDVPQNASVHDPFAPFGSDNLTYRVACRTTSGDVAWRDYDYSLLPQGPTDGMLLVVDWDGKRLEFDRCIDTSDAYGKGGNLRVHLDGSRSMYWREGVSRTGSYSAALLRSYDADAEGLLDELARYSGPCLVRTSDGSAYQADVVVSNVAKTHDSARVSVQLQTTEMDGDDTFGATVTEGE